MHVGGWTLFGGFAIILGIIIISRKEIYAGSEYGGDGILLPNIIKYALGAILIIAGIIFIFLGGIVYREMR